MVAAGREGWEDPPARPIQVPFSSRDPLAKHRAVTGINAHVRWYQRIGSLVGIAVLVTLMGVLLAVGIGAFYVGVRVGLELLVS